MWSKALLWRLSCHMYVTSLLLSIHEQQQHNYVNSIILVILWLLFSHKIPCTNDCLFLSYFDAIIWQRFTICALSSSLQTVKSGYFSLFAVQVKKGSFPTVNFWCSHTKVRSYWDSLSFSSNWIHGIPFFCMSIGIRWLSACIFLRIWFIVCRTYFNNWIYGKMSIILWHSKCLLSQFIGKRNAGHPKRRWMRKFQKQTWQLLD